MKHTILCLFCVSVSLVINLYPQSPSTPNTPTIEVVAQTYGENAQTVLTSYNRLFDPNNITALHAVESLEAKQAYSALALALSKVDESLKSSIVNALSKATSRDNLVVQQVSLELGKQNAIVIRLGGEEVAGQHVIKQKLISILSKQTGIDASQVNVDNRQQVDTFLGSVDGR